MARRLATILPDLTLAEATDTTRVHRVAGLTGRHRGLITARLCRAPHHTISDVGPVSMPGEMSLAHHGVRFLDELREFKRHVLEGLRQPLEESGLVMTISRTSSPSTRWRNSPGG